MGMDEKGFLSTPFAFPVRILTLFLKMLNITFLIRG
jgi:hypothetical protein